MDSDPCPTMTLEHSTSQQDFAQILYMACYSEVLLCHAERLKGM